MLDFTLHQDPNTHEQWLETSLYGKPLLTTPQLNKGTAFTQEERHTFGLIGKLPARIESLEEQMERIYAQFTNFQTDLQRHIFLNTLHDTNQILFYSFISEHLEQMLPIIYTPVVGAAVQSYSREFRRARGLYIAYPDRKYMDEILDNRSNPEIDLIVVTDGEGVLGLGDQGVGAINIPIAKLMVYSVCGGINPIRTLPILLDVGTNNPELLADPFYIGWRHERLKGAEYDEFIECFIQALKRKFPHVLMQWEDFGRGNAKRNLDRYRQKICSFNDDIQGTGAVALAAILAGIKAQKATLAEQRIVILGAGNAGTGIADQVYAALVGAGIDSKKARRQIWLVDREGLLIDNMNNLTPEQTPYAHPLAEIKTNLDLLGTIKRVKPTILIGCSTQAGAFTQEIIETMAHYVPHPIILPLSNPTTRCEATPQDLMNWTKGKALIAMGGPSSDILVEGHKIRVAQCNNALVFPGIGLGVLAVRAREITENMICAASHALSESASILYDRKAALLPSLDHTKKLARHIAKAVARTALEDGVALQNIHEDIETLIDRIAWEPRYIPLRKKSL